MVDRPFCELLKWCLFKNIKYIPLVSFFSLSAGDTEDRRGPGQKTGGFCWLCLLLWGQESFPPFLRCPFCIQFMPSFQALTWLLLLGEEATGLLCAGPLRHEWAPLAGTQTAGTRAMAWLLGTPARAQQVRELGKFGQASWRKRIKRNGEDSVLSVYSLAIGRHSVNTCWMSGWVNGWMNKDQNEQPNKLC